MHPPSSNKMLLFSKFHMTIISSRSLSPAAGGRVLVSRNKFPNKICLQTTFKKKSLSKFVTLVNLHKS